MKEFLMSIVLICVVFLVSCGSEKPAAKEPAAPADAAAASSQQAAESSDDNSWGYVDDDYFEKNPQTAPAPIAIDGGLVHDIGELLEGQKKRLQFTIRNTSDKPWRLQEINASCSCTNIDGIPGGIVIPANGSWVMDVRVDAEKIDIGPFEREIILMPLKFAPVRLKLKGEVKRFVQVTPASKTLKFEAVTDGAKPWKTRGLIKGLGDLAGKMRLEVVARDDEEIKTELTETAPGVWQVTCSPLRPLPYTSHYQRKVTLRILNDPGRYPDIALTVSGRVGMTLAFSPGRAMLTDESFDANGNYTFSSQLGFDPNKDNSAPAVAEPAPATSKHPAARRRRPPARTSQAMIDAYVDNVDWDTLFANLKINAPAGVTVKPVFTRFGVRLDITIAKSAFADNKVRLPIEATCHGRRLALIAVSYGKPEESTKSVRPPRSARSIRSARSARSAKTDK